MLKVGLLVFLFAILILGFASAVDIGACQTLSDANTVYDLNQSVTAGTTCFTISADNITIDGNGFEINYSSSGIGYGININSGADNLTVRNVTINHVGTAVVSNGINAGAGTDYFTATHVTIRVTADFSYGISVQSEGINLTYNNISSTGNTAYALNIASSDNGTIFNNNLTGGSTDVVNLGGEEVNFTFNRIYTAGDSSTSGLRLLNIRSSNISYNIINYGSDNGAGILITSSSGNRVFSNTINITGENSSGIEFSGDADLSPVYTISNNTIIGNGFYDLTIDQDGWNGTILSDQIIGAYNLSGIGGRIVIENTTYGKIEFLINVNGPGENLIGNDSADIIFGNNSVFVNSTRSVGLNKSANVTLYGIGERFTEPIILRDGVECTDCYNFTSLSAENVTFNVSSWSNYSIGEGYEEPEVEESSSSNSAGYIPSFWSLTYNEDDEEFEDLGSIVKNLEVKERVKLSINGDDHFVGIVEIGDDYVIVNVSSDPQQARLDVSEEVKFDVDSDEVYDIRIVLNSISDDVANLEMFYLSEEVEEVVNVEESETGTVEEDSGEIISEEKSNLWIWIVVALVIIIGVVIYLKKVRFKTIK